MIRPELGVTSWFLPERGIGALKWAAEAGFGHIHVDTRDCAISDPATLRARSAELGVALSGLAVDLLETTGVLSTAAMATVDSALTIANQLGVTYVYLPSFGAAEIRTPNDLRATASLLRYAADAGREQGVTVATENALSALTLHELLKAVDRDDVELLFDTQNLSHRGLDPYEVIGVHGSRIGRFVHVKDGINELGDTRLGRGMCGVGPMVAALRHSGFRGSFVIENDYRTARRVDVRSDITWFLRADPFHTSSTQEVGR